MDGWMAGCIHAYINVMRTCYVYENNGAAVVRIRNTRSSYSSS